MAPCLGIDLPGCGRSAFSPTRWDAYGPEALAELIAEVVAQHCHDAVNQGIVFIGHSMGCSLSALAAVKYISPPGRGPDVLGLIGVCPRAGPYSKQQQTAYKRLLFIPTSIFDVYRAFDRRKGLESPSITQFVGKEADTALRLMQMRFNRQSRTPVFRRMAWGFVNAIPGAETWSKLKVPVFLAAGEADAVTKPEELVEIGKAMGKLIQHSKASSDEHAEALSSQPSEDDCTNHLTKLSQTETVILNHSEADHSSDLNPYSRKRIVLKTCVLPAPAAHGLLYAPSTYRILAGLIQTFLSSNVDTRLSLGWQLQHLSTEGKWDVKNLAKWQSTEPVSDPIAGVFRALKTMREIDEVHSPGQFAQRWRGQIRAVIDISHESPVYDPKGLEDGGIEYHKIPTVSKIPPTSDEVREFVQLVDRLRGLPSSPSTLFHREGDGTAERDTPDESGAQATRLPTDNPPLIGVHCHYGFNRTGFFICAYLIEREGYTVQAAIDEFAAKRPHGIKHAHFLDMLWVRYCVGLKRAPTM